MKNLMMIVTVFFMITYLAIGQGVFEFEKVEHDFGKIKEGEKAIHSFMFKNTGDAPINISSVKSSCGCTIPEWPKKPVLPGETGEIKALYNSKNRLGSFVKSITVTSNASETTTIVRIRGEVITETEE